MAELGLKWEVGAGSVVVPPDLAPHPEPRAGMASWLYALHVGIERLDQAAYTWDDVDAEAVVWDTSGVDELVWDAPESAGGYLDAVCDLVSLETDPGEADVLGLLPSTSCSFTLENTSGQWSAWSADGRLVYWALGRRVYVWARHPDYPTVPDYWVFAGRIAEWHERSDGYIEVVAYDGLAELAQPIVSGAETWVPGDAGDTAHVRIVKIASHAGYSDTVTAGAGSEFSVPLSARASSSTPLDEAYITMLSDGGLLSADANGVLVVLDRRWRLGRLDQTVVPVITDNVIADGVADVWDVELGLEDAGYATSVRLVNDAGVVADVDDGTVTASRFRLTHPEADLWLYEGDGFDLARYLLQIHQRQGMRLSSFALHLEPRRPQDRLYSSRVPWYVAANVRRGDLVNFLHDYVAVDGQPGRLDTFHRIDTVAHAITPDSWMVTYRASPVVTYADPQLWDASEFTWDDPHPDNVWS